ncbi:hypothetical protein [Mucilaginibacter sp. SP1R1]|uniref:hypothetical protein n=1 Tax=Mucilaginibacter sp. SP1R1 TaxID=2723091 RepID=UPI001618442D|nr:hypothetical protein [Mucilaginibacter sp. SP1R1]MBB6148617.1 hypothetical protein [Mucilaginibacter sp. SP1R1]
MRMIKGIFKFLLPDINQFIWGICIAIGFICFTGCKQSAPRSNGSKTQTVKSELIKRPVIVEIIVPEDSVFQSHALYDLAKGFALEINDINQWENHIAVYANISNTEELVKSIQNEYPQDTVKYFDKPFYTFNRKMCADTISSKNWENIFLSANLVNNLRLQQEYLNYHSTQFEKWPGLC